MRCYRLSDVNTVEDRLAAVSLRRQPQLLGRLPVNLTVSSECHCPEPVIPHCICFLRHSGMSLYVLRYAELDARTYASSHWLYALVKLSSVVECKCPRQAASYQALCIFWSRCFMYVALYVPICEIPSESRDTDCCRRQGERRYHEMLSGSAINSKHNDRLAAYPAQESPGVMTCLYKY